MDTRGSRTNERGRELYPVFVGDVVVGKVTSRTSLHEHAFPQTCRTRVRSWATGGEFKERGDS